MTRWIAMIIAVCVLPGCDKNKVSPEQAARQWADSMGMKPKGVNCTTKDTDNNGYVSCTVSVAVDDQEPRLHAIECAMLGTWEASGCKIAQPKARVAN